MNQSLGAYNPPSFDIPMHSDYKTFVKYVENYLVNQLAQYQQQFFQQVVNILNTGTQAFGKDLPATSTLNITNWAHRITTAGTITVITPPNGYQSFIVLLAVAPFSLGTGGNIAIAKGPFNIGEHVHLVFSPIDNLWYPAG